MNNQTSEINSTSSIPQNIEQQIKLFLDSLEPIEKKAYLIAEDHLGTTFNIAKSNAFLRWKKENGLL